MKIKTDHKWKNLLYGYELTDKERLYLDHLTNDEIDGGSFIRYKGVVYDVGEFMHVSYTMDNLAGWHGYHSESYFTGIVIKLSDDGEQYMVGRYYG